MYKFKTLSKKQMFFLLCNYKKLKKEYKKNKNKKLEVKLNFLFYRIKEEFSLMIIGFMKRKFGNKNPQYEEVDYDYNDIESFIHLKIYQYLESFKFIHKNTLEFFDTYEEFREYCFNNKLKLLLKTNIINYLSLQISNHISNQYKNKINRIKKNNKCCEINLENKKHNTDYNIDFYNNIENNIIIEGLELFDNDFNILTYRIFDLFISGFDKKFITSKFFIDGYEKDYIEQIMQNALKLLLKNKIQTTLDQDILDILNILKENKRSNFTSFCYSKTERSKVIKALKIHKQLN